MIIKTACPNKILYYVTFAIHLIFICIYACIRTGKIGLLIPATGKSYVVSVWHVFRIAKTVEIVRFIKFLFKQRELAKNSLLIIKPENKFIDDGQWL